jgi:hypothetical protein
MKPATAELLQSLEQAEWFAQVGEEADIPRLAQVASWDEAVRACTSQEWNDFRRQIQNHISIPIWETSQERWRAWPAIGDEIHARVWDMIQRKAAHVPVAEAQRMPFYGSISWDLDLAAMEVEHADIVEPGLASLLAEIYKLGRFPCGDEEGTGRLVVY